MHIPLRFVVGIAAALLVVIAIPPLPAVVARSDVASRPVALSPSRAAGLPRVMFEPNEGQVNSRVRYIAHLAHANLLLTRSHILLTLLAPMSPVGQPPGSPHTLIPQAPHGRAQSPLPAFLTGGNARTSTVDLRLIDANPRVEIVGLGRLPGHVNYFIGSSPRTWHTDIPLYARVAYLNIYPHIDLVFHDSQRQIEYDWILHPGARISSMALQISGGTSVIRRDGALVIHTPLVDIEQGRPHLFERLGRSLHSVQGGYIRTSTGRIGFWAGHHNRLHTLVIDPVLRYATFLGGSASDWGGDIAVDHQGNAYIVGSTLSLDYPLVHPLPGPGYTSLENAVVSKLNATGDALIFSTYLGGEADDDGTGIALDALGYVYVTGFTRSIAFPTVHPLPRSTCNADRAHSGDAFVAELSARGDALLTSTCLGGSGPDWPAGIAVDSAGAMYVAGTTVSDDFPVLHAMQPKRAGGSDVFVVKIVHRQLAFSTYFGGSNDDQAGAMVVDDQGNVAIAGSTASTDFPTHDALQNRYAGGSDGGIGTGDAFIARLDPQGRLAYSSYLGGPGDDQATAIAIDASGSLYVAGLTSSSSFPTVAAEQAMSGGGTDAFVAKLSADGTRLLYSTFLGGEGRDAATGIAVDSRANAYVAGSTSSRNFPLVNPLQAQYGGGSFYGDAFVATLDAQGRMQFATYLGGQGEDIASSIALDDKGAVFLTGGTSSIDFPTTVGLAGTSPDRGNAFIVKLDTTDVSVTPDRVKVDRIGLFRMNSNGIEVPTVVVQPGRRVLFISQYHTVGIVASGVHATIWFTAGGRKIGTKTMQPATSIDRRPTVYLLWQVPRHLEGGILAHVMLAIGTATDTKTLRFRIAAGTH